MRRSRARSPRSRRRRSAERERVAGDARREAQRQAVLLVARAARRACRDARAARDHAAVHVGSGVRGGDRVAVEQHLTPAGVPGGAQHEIDVLASNSRSMPALESASAGWAAMSRSR